MLPTAAENQPVIQLRWIYHEIASNGGGSRPELRLDDVSVSSQPVAATPSLSISNVTLAEGNAGTTTFSFTVSLSAPAPAGGVTFDITTANNTAIAPGDYTAKSLTGQTIAAGSSTYTFDVLVNGDVTVEPNETFFVNVSNVTGAAVSTGQGTGTITNDDAAVSISAINNGPYLMTPTAGPAFVSGVISDPTDPATTLGLNLTLSAGNLTVTASSSNQAVVPNANLALTGTGASRNLKITPVGVGTAIVTVMVSDGTNTGNYVINYAASAASTSTSRFHTGRSDASTAQDAGSGYMFVGDDESNVLRLYNRTQSGLPVSTFDFTSSLALSTSNPEVDIEASAKNGNRIYWFGSQSNSSGGNSRPNRDRVFTTDVTGSGATATLTYVGRYDFLREDIIAWDVNNTHGKGANFYGLQASAASGTDPKINSGYNIEGTEFAPDGTTMYIGFRAPQVPLPGRTKALVVPVTNLTTLAASGGTQGSSTFGAPIELDLGGRGIREIKKNAANQYLIIAGPAGGNGPAPNDFRLYTWTGVPTDAPELRAADLSNLSGSSDGSSIESIVEMPATLDASSSIQFVMDNGDIVYYNDGTIAKDLTQNNFKKSRSDYATVGAALLSTLAANPTTLSNFTALTGTASAPQVYTLTGTNLTANASVSVTAGFEVSADGTTFGPTAMVPQTSGAISQTVAVRLASSPTPGAVNGTVTNISTSATATVALSGSVSAPVVVPPFVGTLANYTFEGDVITPTTTAPNITASDATFGSGVGSPGFVGGNPGRARTGNNWGTTFDFNDYIQVIITPATGYQVSVTSIIVDVQRSGTGPTTAELRSSADNFGAAIGSTNVVPTSFGTITFPVSPAQNSLTPLTYRIYGYASTGTNGTLRFDNLNVNGSVISSTAPFITAMPSPVSLSYTAGSGPASQVVTVNAGNLSPAAGNITVTSSSTAVTATPSTLAYTGGAVSGTTFTAQLVAGLAVGSYPATLTLTNGTTSTTLAVNGTVSNTLVSGGITFIHDIQGSGSTAALTGTRTIEGIVTRTFATTVTGLGGFFVQEEDADSDANPATSEGIFVYDPSVFFSGAVGDKVRLTGAVTEYTSTAKGNNSSLTEITLSAATNLTVVTNSNPLPTIVNVTLPVASVSDLEKYEGMLVTMSAASGNLTVTEYFELGRYGQVLLSADAPTNIVGTDPRLDQYTQFYAPSVSGYATYLAEIDKRRIYLDDGNGSQNVDPILFGRGGQPLSASNTLRGGDDVASITAILDERFEGYRLQTQTGVNFQPTNMRPTTGPPVGGTLKTGNLNVLNYFNTFGTANFTNCAGNSIGGRGANNSQELTRQRTKIVQNIITSGLDVMGINEMQNNGYDNSSAIQDLVNGLNTATAPGTYTFVNAGCISTDAITVAMLYKPAKVTLVGASASLATSSFFNATGRQPLAQTFREIATGGIFTLVTNHWKSKGSTGATGSDNDQNDGQGAFNVRRTGQAQDLLTWLATKPTGTNDPDYLIVGDLNAYAKEVPLTTLENGGYTNLVPNTTYSYVFDGFVGALDHALRSGSLQAQIAGADKYHINADEPSVLDYNTEFKSAGQIASLYAPDQYRSSDHDPVVVGLNLTPSLSATLVASTSVCAGSPASFSLTVAGLGTNDTYSYTITNGTNSTMASGVSASAVQTSVVPTVAGSFTATVLTSASNSTTAASGNVAINDLPTNASLTSGTLTCAQTSVTLVASSTGGTSYTLSDGQTNSSGQFTVSTPGTYTVTVSNASGCTATATGSVVSNTAAPTNASLTSGTLTCSVTSVTLTASATGGASYTLSDGQTNTTGQFVVSTPGTYTVTISGANGCTATATSTVSSNTTAPANASLTSGTLTCATTSVTLTASATGGTSYTLSDGQSNANGQFVVSTQGTYTVTVSNANGCTATATGSVVSNTTAPNATLVASSNTACSPTAITLTAGGGTSYTFSAGATQIGMTNQATVTQSGTYSVTVSNVNGCTATASTSVTVNTPPSAPTLTGVSRTVTQSNTPLPLGQFVSAPGTLSFSGVSGLLNPPNADISQVGTQSFSVTQTDANGCISAATPFTITIQQSTPTTPGSQTVCRSSAVVLTAITTGVRYEWYKNGTSAPFKLTEIASIQKGTKTESLTLVSIQTTASYYCKVFQANGSFTFDGPFQVVVNYSCIAPGARLAAESVVEVPLSVVLTPNPVVDGQLRAVVRGAAGQALSVELVDLNGQVVRSQKWSAAEGEQVVEWNISQQPTGLYLLQVQMSDANRIVKVIKK